MDAEEELRRLVFKTFRCLPGQLERAIAKVLGSCVVRLKRILGCGSYNIVLEAALLDRKQQQQQQQEDHVAIRIPQFIEPNPLTPAEAASGYAATLFLSSLGLPTVVAGPVHLAGRALAYTPPGKSHFTVMRVAEGVPIKWPLWKATTLEWKKTVVADLASFALELYRHPFSAMGGMSCDDDGRPCVGAMPAGTGAVSTAMERGIDVGELSPGPYSTWKDYARNQIEGLKLLYGRDHRYGAKADYTCGELMNANLDLVLEWLNKFQVPGESEEGSTGNKFYLSHPDFNTSQVLVDPCSGHVTCILDWDGAVTGTLQSLGSEFYLPGFIYEDYEGKDELFEVYSQQLIQGGASELVQHVRKLDFWKETDPQVLFDCTFSGARGPYSDLIELCLRMGELGFMDPAVKLKYFSLVRPWHKTMKKPAQDDEEAGSSSSTEEATSDSSSSALVDVSA